MVKKTDLATVPEEVGEETERRRAITLQSYLARWVPYWGHPGWLNATRWRSFVRNQSVAIICRDTLISNMLAQDWDIKAREPDDVDNRQVKSNIDYYKELFQYLEGDFDHYCELMAQDMYDLPFGAMSEIVREDDEPDGRVVNLHHVDAATLFPTGIQDFPVQQRIPELPGAVVNFPDYTVARMMMTPRPEIRRKGWGMAPPEKAYLSIEMLFRGDRYYANLLLDTPEAGILDLVDMAEEDADEWIEGFRTLFAGIDGFKVPVLHSHKTPAQWIPLNRPPIDMMYNEVTLKYAAIMAAAYGLRLSDIGMAELGGEKTLAGVIRGERQTRRSGFSTISNKFYNHFNYILPRELEFVWIDDDEETKLSESKTLVSFGQGLNSLKGGGLISVEEARQEIVARGLLKINIDPDQVPEDPMMAQQKMQQQFQEGQQDKQFQFQREQNKPAFPFGRQDQQDKDKKVPASQGGRGEGGFSLRSFLGIGGDQNDDLSLEGKWTKSDLLDMMNQIIEPAMQTVVRSAEPIRIRRLIKAAVRSMVPSVSRTFMALDDNQIVQYWLPEMMKLDWDLESELDSVVMRANINDTWDELEKHLEDDEWWRTASELEKARILRIYMTAFEVGLEDMALQIIRSLYEEGLRSEPYLINVSFDLVNPVTIAELETRAADLVKWVDQGTKTFIKRIITSGVRQGLSSPKIAQGIREGQAAEWILRQDDFMDDVEQLIRTGLVEMSEARSNSIVNTEINRAENQGKHKQMNESGLTTKKWVHLGERGVTDAGNQHPCPVCDANEKLGFVPMDYAYPTVFKTGGVDGKGGEHTPPGHPNVCHCTIIFNEDELFNLVEAGEYTPYTGN